MMFDVAVIGGGIVGLATARELQRRIPNCKLTVLEKEADWATHQTGRNSGVIHSGIYYQPNSLKAKMARDGSTSIAAFCRENGIAHEICGKLIVAVNSTELEQLERLRQRGIANGLAVTQLSSEQAKEVEPHVSCVAALRVKATGIVNYQTISTVLAAQIQSGGGSLQPNTLVHKCHPSTGCTEIVTTRGVTQARHFVNCAGLHSDRVARMDNCEVQSQIVPFRGEYYELKPERRFLVKNLIYPVPDPRFPFLGVHFTRMMDGSIHAGPNAVLSLKREGYSKASINIYDSFETLSYAGFWRLASRHMSSGLAEIWRSFSKKAFAKSLQKLIPEITEDDLIVSQAGVRAQALLPNGCMVDDFSIGKTHRGIHVLNAPSPAATASLEIAKYIAGELQTIM